MMEIAQNLQETSAPSKGLYIFTAADVSSSEAKAFEKCIVILTGSGEKIAAGAVIKELNNRFGKEIGRFHNLLPTIGRTAIARRLGGDTTYTNVINYIALGSSSTPPANSDTQLTTETYRRLIASATWANNITYISGFFTAAECSGTFNECGLEIDGTASANSGQLYTHALISVTKTTAQTLTVDIQITQS